LSISISSLALAHNIANLSPITTKVHRHGCIGEQNRNADRWIKKIAEYLGYLFKSLLGVAFDLVNENRHGESALLGFGVNLNDVGERRNKSVEEVNL
jgi:hypothetical protein